MKRVAMLDGADVFVGMLDLPDDATLTDRHLELEVDLPPGRYRWVRTGNRYGGEFVPLGPAQIKPAANVPTLERVVYRLIEALGAQAPQDARVWAAWYRDTIDGRP